MRNMDVRRCLLVDGSADRGEVVELSRVLGVFAVVKGIAVSGSWCVEG